MSDAAEADPPATELQELRAQLSDARSRLEAFYRAQQVLSAAVGALLGEAAVLRPDVARYLAEKLRPRFEHVLQEIAERPNELVDAQTSEVVNFLLQILQPPEPRE